MKINKILFGIFLLSFTTFAQVNAPDSLTARVGEPGPLPLSVILFWHYNDTSTPVRFMIYKKTGPISDTTHQYVRQLPTFEKNYIDPLVQQGSIYSYYVTAMMGMVESAPSDTVQITVTGPQINSGKISGNLFTDSTNAPIPGGVVAVLPAALNSIFQGMELRTDSLGNFSGYVEAGDYYLFSTAPGYKGEFYDNASTITLAKKITVTAGDSLVINIGLAKITSPVIAFGKISGKLFEDSTLVPIAKGINAIFPSQIGAAGGPGALAVTDSNGNFSVRLRTGQYYMYSYAPGYQGEFFDDVSSLPLATRITLNSGDSLVYSIGLAKLVPPTAYTVSGSVKDSTGAPLQAQILTFIVNRQQSPSAWQFRYLTKTDSSGNYQLKGVRPNDTLIVFASPRDHKYSGQFYNDKTTFRDADRIGVVGNMPGINFVLSAKPIFANGITGTVKDSAGNPILKGDVHLYSKVFGKFGWKGSMPVDTVTGAYSFTNLEPGKYFVLAAAPGYIPSYFRYDGSNTLNWKNADSVIVPADSVISGINFNLKQFTPPVGGGFVFGTDKGIDGSLLGGTLNYALDANGGFVDFSISELDGSYLLQNFQSGTYTVVSDQANYQDVSTAVTIDYLNISTRALDVTLAPSTTTGINDKPNTISGFALNQNYPNPFNPNTIISYSIPQSSHVTLRIYNILGQEVATLVNEDQKEGTYNYNFHAGRLASGVYIYQLTAGNFTATKKLTLLK